MVACSDHPSNYPHGKHDAKANTYFTSFAEQPKTLDPAKSYSADEAIFTAQIYEPPLQYNYFKRPYVLEPLTLTEMPEVRFYNHANKLIINPKDLSQVAYTTYTLRLKPNIYYQPHPAFAKNKAGKFIYQNLNETAIRHLKNIQDFKQQGTRVLTAKDYILGIKRLAAPWNNSPIYGLLAKHIQGFTAFHHALSQSQLSHLDALLTEHISGVQLIDKFSFRITVKGYYPQFIYWLAMPFFAPIPEEGLAFYHQGGLKSKNISLAWYPIGTGPYMLVKNDPNHEMILARNPNYHEDYFPQPEGKNSDAFVFYTGKKLPFVDKYIFKLEKESIPRWHKFLQGYYDQSGVGAEQFEQAISYDAQGNAQISSELKKKNISLSVDTEPSIFYLGFNMQDPIVGGSSQKNKKLRQAISIAIDYEEFVSLFMNGRAIVAQSPLPPNIHDSKQNLFNATVYEKENDLIKRKPLIHAKKLLAEAGYPDGMNEKTGKPLVLNFSAVSGGGPGQRAQFDWLRKQFAKLGIELQVETTQYSRFQDKIRTGDVQLFFFGWNADYPDPENFLFLLYGPNSKFKTGGENVSNYQNESFDKLFLQLQKTNTPTERNKLIDQMIAIVQEDAPWVWGFHQQVFQLSQAWLGPKKIHGVANNTLKYVALNGKARALSQKTWNQPKVWIVFLIVFIVVIFILPAVIIYYKKERKKPQRFNSR